MSDKQQASQEKTPCPPASEETILSVEDLAVRVDDKEILNGINLNLEKGQTHVLFGPNGSGKTSLLLTIAGFPNYKITRGKIIFNKKDITKSTVDERARKGIGTGFQLPQEIRGVKLLDMLKICAGKKPTEDLDPEELELVEKFMLDKLLDRDVNHNFSGGEMKRAEILQLLLMKPRLLLLDEPDSGVDVESLKLIGREIRRYVDEADASALVITHQGSIMEELKAERGYVLVDRRIHCHKKPDIILETIRRRGYKECVMCWEGEVTGTK